MTTDDQTAAERHPLATQRGLSTFLELLQADQVWQRTTNRQRDILREVCAPLIERLDAVTGSENTPVHIGERPVVTAPTATLRSMHAQQLIDNDERLTARAIHATYWTVWRERPPPGDSTTT